MILKGKIWAITSQCIIILIYFGALFLNYVCLFPVIDSGEGSRLSSEIGSYCDHFLPQNGCDVRDKRQRDSVLALGFNPYKEGDLRIIDTKDNSLIYPEGETGDALEIIHNLYGDLAVSTANELLKHHVADEHIDYDWSRHTSFYVSGRPDSELLFFYAIDYHVSGNKLLRTYNLMIFLLTLGGIIVIISGYSTIRRMNAQVRKDFAVQQELDTASKIQKSMLPSGQRHLLQLDVDARLIPARKVAGDFFCYIVQEGLVYFCIGDVSGKGIPASLFMSKAVTLFRSNVKLRLAPCQIADNMNEELCFNNLSNMFMTGIIGTMSVSDGTVRYVNAGHEPPVIWNGDPKSQVTLLESEGNIPFGLFANTEYQEEQYAICKNGLLMFYTDGISESRGKEGSLLGRKAVQKIIEGCKSLASKEINDRLLDFVSVFEAGTEQFDDITLLTFRNVPAPKRMVIKNEVPELRKISAFTEDVFNECQLDSKQLILVRAGLDEALTNCVRYAYESQGQEIEVTASIEDHCLIFTIEDCGKSFNPLEYAPEPSSELKVGGLGISIYKANFDEVKYTREDDRNILKLI